MPSIVFILFSFLFLSNIQRRSARAFGTPPFNELTDVIDTSKFASDEPPTDCTIGGNLTYDDIFDELLDAREGFIQNMRDAGGFINFLEQNRTFHDEVLLSLANSTSRLVEALECCRHPTSTLNLTYNYGCPRNTTVCLFDTRLDERKNVIGLYRPAGCCPVESSKGCFSGRPGNGLRGCCPGTHSCCFSNTPGVAEPRWMGCAKSHLQCCGDKICAPFHTCCRNPHGYVCCPRIGASCFDQDYSFYDRKFGSLSTDDSDGPILISDHFNITFGVDGCVPSHGAESGPIKYSYFVGKSTQRLTFNRYECGEPVQNRSNFLLRPLLITAPHDEKSLDEFGEPIYEFADPDGDNTPEDIKEALQELDIDLEQARHLISHGDLNFTKCGKHLCYGSTHFCVRRFTNTSFYTNHAFINITDILIIQQELEDLADANATDDIFPPPPLDQVVIDRVKDLCSPFNATYFDGLVDAGIFGNHFLWDTIYRTPIPSNCIVSNVEFRIKSYAVGCCPVNSTPCGSYPHSFSLPIPAEMPRTYSIFDPMIGCTLPGEICCAMETICPVGFNCHLNRYTSDGIHPPLMRFIEGVLKNDTSFVGDRREALLGMLRPGILSPFLSDPNISVGANILEHNHFLSAIDAFPMCCLEHSFPCQAEIHDPIIRNRIGRQFHYFCSLDPICKFPIWQSSYSSLPGGLVHRGVPAADLIFETPDIGRNGTYDYLEDILIPIADRSAGGEIDGKYSFPFRDESGNPIARKSGSSSCDPNVQFCGALDDATCEVGITTNKTNNPGNNIIRCTQLFGEFVEDDGDSRDLLLADLVTADILEQFPPPSFDSNIVTFDILGTEFEVNVTSIFSILSPLNCFFARSNDYTAQLVREQLYGEKLIGFPASCLLED